MGSKKKTEPRENNFLDENGNFKNRGVKRQLSVDELIESAKRKKRVNFKELLALGLIPWISWKTTKRKIEHEGFPAIKQDGHYYFEVDQVELWFKKRKIINAA